MKYRQSNYLQLLFVFAAFAFMAGSAYFFIGRIMRSHLLNGAQELLVSAEANVRAGLSEAEVTLLNSYYIVQGMIERDASRQEILDYLIVTTDWMRRRDAGLLDFYGIYGFIYGEFFDGIGMNPDEDYIPQTRPWYQLAIRSGANVAYTTPYMDLRTGDTIVSVVRNIQVNGEPIGILAVDININWLVEYVGSMALTDDGFGMLLSQNLIFMAYPDENFLGSQLQELGGAFPELARILRSGEDVVARRIIDPDRGAVIVFIKHIFNNWYVGLVTPSSQFDHDLHTSAQFLVVLGVLLSLALCFILVRLSAAKQRSDEESKAKSSFLATMSHEIRTPMNAITGMSEMLLRRNLPEDARMEVQDIKQAANNLLSIINDILDFSKIEAGKLEILPVRYMLSSLVNDVVNIIRMRLIERPIRFFTNIDGNIPNNLIGDELRLRQIILNLLSNAAKYTEKGHISMSITLLPADAQKQMEKQIWLKISVSDTGPGIKPEDQLKLFGDFMQLDSKKNRSIEGTGLGLAISKRLCLAMGGDVTVKSEYGHGSEFTVVIPQQIETDTPFAAVTEPKQKKVLVYEGRNVYARSVCWSLENMGVPYTVVENEEDFAAALNREEWFYVFSGYGLYNKIKPILENAVYPGGQGTEGKQPPLALLVEWGTETYIPNARFVSLPVQSLSIANTLNGKADSREFFHSIPAKNTILATYAGARILVVDDLPTNLKVAEGLLAPYKAMVDTCLSGAEAVELVKRHAYDLVFMDHMMPGMDGIEATAIIRAWEKEQAIKGQLSESKRIPIVALTANAVSGMREMFLEKGFNDFLAKPIDVTKLDEMLDRWIPGNLYCMDNKEKTLSTENTMPEERTSSLFAIPSLDARRGIAMTGGTEARYKEVLSLFCRDAEDRLAILQTPPKKDTLPLFITQVHALKSASGSIGAANFSALAAELESAGRAEDVALINEKLPGFVEQLLELTGKIKTALDSMEKEEFKNPNSQVSGFPSLVPLLKELASALESNKANDISRILKEIKEVSRREPLDTASKDALEQISDEVMMVEYDNARKILEELLAAGAHGN